jgi:hypothetical protein
VVGVGGHHHPDRVGCTLSANTYTPATGNVTVLVPVIGSGWSTGKPAGKEAGLSSPQVPAARLSGVQGKIAEVNVAPNVVVRNSTDPPPAPPSPRGQTLAGDVGELDHRRR